MNMILIICLIIRLYLDAKDVFSLLKGDKLKPGEEPTFTWFKSGQEFNPDDRFKVLFVNIS